MSSVVAAPNKAKIDELMVAMFAETERHVSLPLVHTFAEGLYAREAFLNEGTTAVGKVHKQEHICFLIQGECLVVTDYKSEAVQAPAYFVVPAGTRNCVHALTDVRWVTVHAVPTEVRDLDVIEQTLVEPVATPLLVEKLS